MQQTRFFFAFFFEVRDNTFLQRCQIAERERERKRTGDVPQNATYRCTLCTVGAIIIINFNYRFAQHSTNHKYSYTYPTGCLCQSKKKKSAGGIHELCALTHTHTHTRLALLLLSHLNALCVHVAPNKRTSHTHREGDREGGREVKCGNNADAALWLHCSRQAERFVCLLPYVALLLMSLLFPCIWRCY